MLLGRRISSLASPLVEVVRFTDEYDLVADLYGVSPGQLRQRDLQQGRPVRRWMAMDGGEIAGAVSTFVRPDRRVFLSFTGSDRSSMTPLATAVRQAFGRPVHTFVDVADAEGIEALANAGFEPELVSERFEIRFDAALHWLRRAWVPTGMTIQRADAVDEGRLFTLDNTLRQDLAGCDGWRGDRDLFHEELTDAPPFVASAYLVGVDRDNGEYVGLVRVWRNPVGPRLGLVGVLRQYRNTSIAAALLAQALSAASGWGHATFVTDTSPANPVTYPRLRRLADASLGQFLQMRL